tara:strand:- start:8396 stop:8506 length:111 start_codon:yes stop_codon:yes gene_type:complete
MKPKTIFDLEFDDLIDFDVDIFGNRKKKRKVKKTKK